MLLVDISKWETAHLVHLLRWVLICTFLHRKIPGLDSAKFPFFEAQSSCITLLIPRSIQKLKWDEIVYILPLWQMEYMWFWIPSTVISGHIHSVTIKYYALVFIVSSSQSGCWTINLIWKVVGQHPKNELLASSQLPRLTLSFFYFCQVHSSDSGICHVSCALEKIQQHFPVNKRLQASWWSHQRFT